MIDPKTSSPRPSLSYIGLMIVLCFRSQARSQILEPRWGHAAVYIPSPPSLLIQGGKTDTTSSFTYMSAPNSGDTILIPLDQEFPTSAPPIRIVDTDLSPANAFHTLTALRRSGSAWDILSFGGDGGPMEPTQTQADSAWVGKVEVEDRAVDWTRQNGEINLKDAYTIRPQGLQPIARGDGSGAIFSDVYAYDVEQGVFDSLPSLPRGVFHHSSLLLANGSLILLGGVTTSPVTGNPASIPLDTAYILDTTANGREWQERSLSGSSPEGRRGASLVLTAGSKAMLFGGGDPALTTAYGDGWELDLNTASWRQVSDPASGPGARFGHTAVEIGDNQIAVYGGYDGNGPVGATLHIWDSSSSAWVQSFRPPIEQPPTVNPTATTAQEKSQTMEDASTLLSTRPNGSIATKTSERNETESGSQNRPSASSSGELASNTTSPGVMSLGVKLALIIGAVAIAGMIVAGLLYRYRRRKRRAALFGDDTYERPGPPRPYGSREKGGEGLMQESRGSDGDLVEKSAVGGIGNAIGAGWASISSKLSRRPSKDPYAELHDGGRRLSGPTRKSTRRIGSGIRLVGPRPAPSSRYVPVKLIDAKVRGRTCLDPVRESRISMLHDEDSGEYAKERSADWIMSESADHGKWTSARSLLGEEDDGDPFDDGDNDSVAPPIRGGPVPTPRASRSDLDPFDDYNRRTSTFLSTFDDLLSPPAAACSDGGSIPRSQRSGYTASSSDMEEGVVQHAQIVSHSSHSIVPPVESSQAPIGRSESFFKRMTAGGITKVLSRQQSHKASVRVLDIRDPTPAPALWPIESRDQLATPVIHAGPNYPPVAFNGLNAPGPTHSKGPSLSSLHSARSMRDMVIVQREPTASSEGECTIESVPSSIQSVEDILSSTTDGDVTLTASASKSSVHVHTHHGLTAVSETASISTRSSGTETLGSSDSSGTNHALNSSTSSPINKARSHSDAGFDSNARIVSTPTKLRPIPQREVPRPISPGISALATPGKSPSEPPSGSPVPSPLVAHRRPVRDVVNSINKRGGGLPPALSSPSSKRASMCLVPRSPTASKGTKRPATMYETVKREKLLVANPDGRREVNRSNSS